MIEQTVVDGLIENPSESLNVEMKRWIDPTQPAGIEKIVKGVFALRNRNGGFSLSDLTTRRSRPTQLTSHQTPRSFFTSIQFRIISRYASDATFEIAIAWGERDGRQYPIVVVPSGVKVPVSAKRDLKDGSRTAIRLGAIYFRSLESNGTPSTTEARPTDWADIVEICFDNREADVGRFIRRHLSGIDASAILKLAGQVSPPAQTLCDRALKLIDEGETRFQEAIKPRKLSSDEQKLLEQGFWSIGFVIDPPRDDVIANQEFMERLGSSNPRYTGWPVWLDARLMSNAENRPKVVQDAFEYLVVSISEGFSNHVDFARLSPKGEFYLRRLLQDDGVPSRVTPGKAIDPILMILRVAEAMAVEIAFAKALGWTPDQTTLGFAFRWHNLKGRQLSAWANPFYDIMEGGTAHDDQIESCVQFSLETPLSALPQFVDAATKRLFAAFEGATVPRRTLEDFLSGAYSNASFS